MSNETNPQSEQIIQMVRQGDVQGVLQQIELSPSLLRGSPFRGWSLLEVAVLLNCPVLLQILIEEKKARPSKDILALSGGNYYYLKLTVHSGIALFVHACDLGNIEVIEILFEHYVASREPDLKAEAMGDGLLTACTSETSVKVEAIRWLAAHGADVNYNRKGRGTTALMASASVGASQAILTLLELGADVNYKYSGWDALWTAIINRKVEAVRVLLQNGADPYNPKVKPDKKYPNMLPSGNSLDAARAMGNQEILDLVTSFAGGS